MEFAVILVEPKYGGNIGAIARSMMNFDFHSLVIVSPSCSLESDECRERAMHAQSILDDARIVKSFDDAIEDMDYLVGTSAISSENEKRHLRKSLSLKDFAKKIYELEGKIGIAFGREDIGLLNEEIAKCDLLVKIPTSEEYPSLNLSHAVALVLYGLFSSKVKDVEQRPAGKIEKENLYRYIDDLLDIIQYPEYKKENTKIMIKRLLGRAMLGKWEYHTLMGVIKGAVKAAKRAKAKEK